MSAAPFVLIWATYLCSTCGRRRIIGTKEEPTYSLKCGLPQDDDSPCVGNSTRTTS